MDKQFAFMEKVNKYIKAKDMLRPGDNIVVGFSGGADSVCLIKVLQSLAETRTFSLTAVHVNHLLRGEDAERDQKFAEDYCMKHGIPIRVFREDIYAYAKARGMSIEEAGRYIRYKAFEEVRSEMPNGRIAVAHHADDLTETVIMNALRGSDINGLAGIRGVSGHIIRPLLSVTKKEIIDFLNAADEPYCTDDTNSDTTYMRNRIRHEVIPYINSNINAGASRHLNELAASAEEISELIKMLTEEAYISTYEEGLIKCEEFADLHITIKKELIRRLINETGGRLKDITQAHIQGVLELFHKQPGRSIDLPYDIKVYRESKGVRFAKVEEEVSKSEIRIDIPGKAEVPGAGTFAFSIIEDKPDMIEDLAYTKWLDYDKINCHLAIRTRQSEDYMIIDSLGHSKSINRIFSDGKIPAHRRDSMGLIADGNHIIWIPGMRISEYYKVTDKTKRILVISRED